MVKNQLNKCVISSENQRTLQGMGVTAVTGVEALVPMYLKIHTHLKPTPLNLYVCKQGENQTFHGEMQIFVSKTNPLPDSDDCN